MGDKLRVAVVTEPTGWHRSSVLGALADEQVGDVAVLDRLAPLVKGNGDIIHSLAQVGKVSYD